MNLAPALISLVFTLLPAITIAANEENPKTVYVVNTPDVQVVNTPNVNVVNTVPYNEFSPVTIYTAGFSGFGSGIGIPPGILHGYSLSVSLPPGTTEYCLVTVSIEVGERGSFPGTEKRLGIVTAASGSSNAVSHNFSSPIDILFDESTHVAELSVSGIVIDSESSTAGGTRCTAALTADYETTN
jgi:hypothetical protein